jgi:23S rRNA (uracil1939-C5)-methyltransferase
VYDLYSGIGTLALSVAHTAGKVTGIEGSPQAVGDAMANALLNGFPHAEFIAGDVLRTFTPEWVDRHGKPSVIMLDPPRAGTLIEIKKTILYAAPEKIIYLSCNPLSLANDLRMLTSGYRVSLIEPYDQSPHTAHLETLVFLEKEN